MLLLLISINLHYFLYFIQKTTVGLVPNWLIPEYGIYNF